MTHYDTHRLAGRPMHPREKPFYTDMGRDLALRDSEGTTSHLPRYAVWKWDDAKGKPQVAEVGDDLDALRAEHGDGPLVDLLHQAKTD